MNLLITFFTFFYFLLNKITSIELLEKYSSVEVRCSEKRIAFNSADFNLNEEIYFSLTLDREGVDKYLDYDFFDNVDISDAPEVLGLDLSKKEESGPSFSKTVNGRTTSETRHFTIQKVEDKKFIVMGFDCKGTLTIENTKEDEQKNKIIIIVVVMCVFVVIVIIIIAVCCYRRRKLQLGQQALQMGAMGGAGYYPQGQVGVVNAYGSNYMMNNVPPVQPNMMVSPGAYSPMGNDVTQVAPPKSTDQVYSSKRIK